MKVIVTGGTKGIGRAICLLLAKNGADLAICARNSTDLEELKETLLTINESGDFITAVCDVSDKTSVLNFADIVVSSWSHVDVLINNAGLFVPGEAHSEDEGALELMIRTNLYSAYHLSRAIIPMMKSRRSGHIINMSSIAGLQSYPNGGSYSISKFALTGLSKVLRQELKEFGIKVTAIYPGATWTDSWAGVDLPEDRLMQASDIATAVLSAIQMSPSAVVEDITIRPQLGDL